ncbi:heavy metal-binding domain-containing protein [Bacteriovorax sp. Seq25_V]|uniref:heavy metal-binding domain-containing protein n=1 Tax=Bacteriovorax sp. Seq25_V TaxID=1201288 RepID=UPI000389ED61|nr:heavy metal-binding domain-containing protein [Bacteriovorax sp. Seq25_V]EQC46331.1 heavy-metal-binding domain protein [Bacteriovorax sp. Seq25_V]
MSKKSNKEDLTRIEDLSEFLHQEDPETDSLFDDEPPPIETIGAPLANLDDLEDDEDSEDFNNFQEFNPNLSSNESEDNNFTDNSDEENLAFPDIPSESDEDVEDATMSFQNSEFPEFPSDDNNELDELGEPEDDTEDSFEMSSESDSEENEFSSEFDDSAYPDYEESPEEQTEELSDGFELSEDNTEEDFEDNTGDEFSAEDEEDYEEQDLAYESVQDEDSFTDSPAAVQVIHEETPSYSSSSDSAPREDFKDVKEFAKNISYGSVQVGGNPAFSILLKDLLSEDVHDSILAILNEHGLLGDNESIYKQSMMLGNLLIAQISEYSAIYLASKLRKYCVDIQVGLSEDIHPSRSYENENKGLVTKRSIFQNKDKKYKKAQHKFSIEDLLVSKQHQIAGTTIVEHIGVITTSRLVSLGDLSEQTTQFDGNGDVSEFKISSTEIYDLMIKTLKDQAFEKGANAIISIGHTLTPVLNHQEEDGDSLYQLQCSGDAVIIEKNG